MKIHFKRKFYPRSKDREFNKLNHYMKLTKATVSLTNNPKN